MPTTPTPTEQPAARVTAPCVAVVNKREHDAHEWINPADKSMPAVVCECPGFTDPERQAERERLAEQLASREAHVLPPAPLSVWQAIALVMRDLRAVGKTNRVQEGPARFAFRGVDDVMNALHPLLATHGLVIVPAEVVERIPEQRQTSRGGAMNVVHLRVRYLVVGPDGSQLTVEAWGEGQDSGDKATGKAHSMSYKSAMLQTFHVPTEDTPDADADTTPASRVEPGPPAPEHVQRVWRKLNSLSESDADDVRGYFRQQQLPRPDNLTPEQAQSVCDYVDSLQQPDNGATPGPNSTDTP